MAVSAQAWPRGAGRPHARASGRTGWPALQQAVIRVQFASRLRVICMGPPGAWLRAERLEPPLPPPHGCTSTEPTSPDSK